MSIENEHHEKTHQNLSPAAKKLLITAERLFALKGIDSVSAREIAREAGQKNHSALQYHFGSREALIEAILQYRGQPLHEPRQQRLEEMARNNQLGNVRALVELMVIPFAEELLKPPEENYYISLLAQLYSRHQGEALLGPDHVRTESLREIIKHLMAALHNLPQLLLRQRLALMGSQIIYAIDEWDHQRRQGWLELTPETLRWRIANLVDYAVGGLTAPPSTDAARVDKKILEAL